MNRTQNINQPSHVYTYCDTLTSKNKLKKFIILNFLIKKFSPNNERVSVIITNSIKRQKNIVLSSPFHFKTVKTHLYIPTYYYQVRIKTHTLSNERILIFLKQFLLIGIWIQKQTINYYRYLL